MTQAPGVPKWGTSMAHSQRSPNVTCALGVPSPQADISSAMCAQGVPSTKAGAQAPYGRRGVPSTKAGAQAPLVLLVCQQTGRQPKRHICVVSAQPPGRSPCATCEQPQRTRLQLGAWDLLAAASHIPSPNSVVYSESTHSLQYSCYNAE